jgi:hypothetical protein
MRPSPEEASQPLADAEARLRALGERAREGLLREGGARVEERTELAGREQLQHLLRDGADRPARPRRRYRPRLVAIVLAAAAAALVGWWTLLPRPGSGAAAGTPLGTGGVVLVYPLGEVTSFDRFEWQSDPPPPGGRFELLLKSSAGAGAPLLRQRLRETRWTPDAEQRARLPRELWWEVRVLDANGEVLAAEGHDASLRD